jgi:hypothetical protein
MPTERGELVRVLGGADAACRVGYRKSAGMDAVVLPGCPWPRVSHITASPTIHPCLPEAHGRLESHFRPPLAGALPATLSASRRPGFSTFPHSKIAPRITGATADAGRLPIREEPSAPDPGEYRSIYRQRFEKGPWKSTIPYRKRLHRLVQIAA